MTYELQHKTMKKYIYDFNVKLLRASRQRQISKAENETTYQDTFGIGHGDILRSTHHSQIRPAPRVVSEQHFV